MLDKWDWFKIFCTSSIYSVPVQKKLYQRKKLYYNIHTCNESKCCKYFEHFKIIGMSW